ncbi:hypothetical protein [Nonomuraea sp. NPDC049625]|uniref:hypothetical protein n=1 Tax=Nonomuraea sp. NPDC049625 TaxID=3155775 RepID=UPI0034340B82
MDAADKVEHVRAAYAAGELSHVEAAGMLAALAGREGNEAEYGWRADMIFEGLLRCGACGAHLQQDQAAGVISHTCPADGCRQVRIAARVLAPAVAEQVLERLRTPELAPGLLLAIAQKRGADIVPPGTDTVESWWGNADPAAQKELLAMLVDHIAVKPVHDSRIDVVKRLSLAWRHTG